MRTEELGYNIIISFGIGTSQHTSVITMADQHNSVITIADSNIKAWEDSLTEHLPRQASSTMTIPRVPERLRRRDADAYEPQIISFGPYHYWKYGKPSLQAMEKYKRSFLEVIPSFSPEIPRQRYIDAIKEEEAKIRTYYTGNLDHMNSKEFVDMILIDGCFLVAYFINFSYRLSDELDSMVWMHDLIRNDILLLENQLPFFILTKIFELLQFTPSTPSFTDLAINYLKWVDPLKKVDLPPPAPAQHPHEPVQVSFEPPEPVHHLLHLYHLHCLYTKPGSKHQTPSENQPEPEHTPPVSTDHGAKRVPKHQTPSEKQPLLPRSPSSTVLHEAEEHQPPSATANPEHHPHSATALHEAGVKFEKNEEKGTSSLDVTFDNGKMKIPPLIIDYSSKSRLRNLVAFEQFYPNFNKLDRSFTAYVQFMDFIVSTPADVALLHKQGIIRHFLGSDEKAANFFNDLNQGVFVKEDHYLAPLYTDVYYYQKKKWPQWRAMLMHNYCNSPWAVLGIVVGGIILVLTLLQTIFSGSSA